MELIGIIFASLVLAVNAEQHHHSINRRAYIHPRSLFINTDPKQAESITEDCMLDHGTKFAIYQASMEKDRVAEQSRISNEEIEYVVLGQSIVLDGYSIDDIQMPVARLYPKRVVHPITFEKPWTVTECGVIVWRMACPDGYMPLGAIATTSQRVPDTSLYGCVHRDLTYAAGLDQSLGTADANNIFTISPLQGWKSTFFVVGYGMEGITAQHTLKYELVPWKHLHDPVVQETTAKTEVNFTSQPVMTFNDDYDFENDAFSDEDFENHEQTHQFQMEIYIYIVACAVIAVIIGLIMLALRNSIVFPKRGRRGTTTSEAGLMRKDSSSVFTPPTFVTKHNSIATETMTTTRSTLALDTLTTSAKEGIYLTENVIYDTIDQPITVKNTLYSSITGNDDINLNDNAQYDVMNHEHSGSPKFYRSPGKRPAMPLPTQNVDQSMTSSDPDYVDYCIVRDGKTVSVRDPDAF